LPECTRNLANTITSNPPKPTHFRQTQRFSQATIWAGERRDIIRRANTRFGFEISKRTIILDQSTLLANNLSVFF